MSVWKHAATTQRPRTRPRAPRRAARRAVEILGSSLRSAGVQNTIFATLREKRITSLRLARGAGFSLVELLVVIAVISILIAISGAVIANYLARAKETATVTTLEKIHRMMQQRKEAMQRHAQSPDFRANVRRIIKSLKDSNVGLKSVSSDVLEILLKKQLFREAFPQRIPEVYGIDGGPGRAGYDDDGDGVTDFDANQNPDLGELGAPGSDDPPIAAVLREAQWNVNQHDRTTESSELLYLALTRAEVFGTPPEDADAFQVSEIADTDGDGLNEFIDAWGRPLRFYRWPTRLLKPFGVAGADGQPGQAGVDDDRNGTTDDVTELGLGGDDAPWRNLGRLLIEGLPAKPPPASGERDPLNEDPDDPLDRIINEVIRLYIATNGQLDLRSAISEANWHTLMTYHVPLIVSPGPDGQLGLREPFDLDPANGVYGTLAQPAGNVSDPSQLSQILEELSDNITNRNQRAGGR